MSDLQQQSSEIVELTAVDLARKLATRELSSVEVLSAYFAQIDRFNPKVNAIVHEQPRDALLVQAKKLDDHIVKSGPVGPLHGLPQAPKDMMPVAGMVTSKGSPIFKDFVAPGDAVAYERTREAGAIFIGRTNTPEFGLGGHTYNNVYGATRNAFDQSKSAGGSSGGAGVAVALRMLPVADGSDMMGSLRTPAAFNNVFGFRTSLGCVPHGPTEELFFQQFSVTGPMARNVPDLALLLSVQAGFDQRLPLTRTIPAAPDLDADFNGKRIGWLGDFSGRVPVEAEVLKIGGSSLQHFRSIGCEVEDVDVSFDLESMYQAWTTLRSFTFGNTNRALYENAKTRALLKPEAIWEIERSKTISGDQLYQAAKVRSDWYRLMLKLFDQYDYLVGPVTQVMPFDLDIPWPSVINGVSMDIYHRWMEIVLPSTMAGLPSLAAPAGFSNSGLPSGIQIIGRPQADWNVLQLGHAYDQCSGISRTLSPLLASLQHA
ncbi:amidase [Paraburkholderia tropica]|uniref:amidase n=1 Tax=Paraburkholderia tropica TaxID=92647 RepID=UPI0007EC4BA7|nr:amidase [Paraburkholderia tropica]OBR54661.1 amidase [Paraburkholderia tropica]